jgi:hypothetical protein
MPEPSCEEHAANALSVATWLLQASHAPAAG